MRKFPLFILLIALCASIFPHLFTHAQEEQSLSSPERAARQQQDLARFFRRHERVRFNTNEVAEQVRNNRPLSIYTASASFDLTLTPHDMRGENYRAVEVGADGVERSVETGTVRTYKGEVIGRDDSQARFTVDDETLEGLIITPEERYMVEPMGKYSAVAEPTDFIVYKSSDVIEGQGGAGEGPIDRELRHTAAGLAPKVSEAIEMDAVEAVAAVRDIEIATEADAEYVSQLGGAAGARNEILSIMNMVEGVYQQQIDLTFTVVFQNTWTNAATDPYSRTAPGGCYDDAICGGPPPGGLDAKGILNEFMEHWNSRYPMGSPSAGNPRRDVAHMWTGKNVDGNTIGLAWLDVVCSTPTYSYGFSQRLTTAPLKYMVTAHEVGHNLSAQHTTTEAGCANTIMAASGGANSIFQFCPTSINQVKSYVSANSSCLAVGTACTYTISPTSKSFTSTGGNSSETVTAETGCSWTATSNAAWVNITTGSSGSGNGTVSYSVAANNGTTSRTGTLTVAGKTLTITQAGVAAVVPALSLLRLSPSTVAGCKTVTATVTLTAPAPANGVNVTISDNLTAARPPTTVAIPAGLTSKTFTITTVPVAATQTGNVTAKLGLVTKTARLTVRPIGVKVVSLSPSSLIGPATSTGTVILECAAPARGIVVSLSSSNPAIANPTVGSLTILSGATSKTFTVRTVDVATSQSAIIKATAGGITKTRTLTIN